MKDATKTFPVYSDARIIRVVFSMLLAACLISPARAEAVLAKPQFDLEFNGGYRIDQLDWNIAGNIDGDNPNILSELTWDDLEITQVSSRGTVTLSNENHLLGLKIHGSVNYGEIRSGKNQDSDYNGDNRTLEFSRSNNSADEGDVWDLSVGVGPVFKTRNRRLSVTPYLGYSYHEQNLTIQNGYQTIPATGPFADLNTTYDAEWYGVLLGVMLELFPASNTTLHSSLEFHAGTYEAEADWNLRSTWQHPVSFRHYSDEAAGILAAFGLKSGGKNLLFNIDLIYQKWRAEDGTDKTYFSNGTIGITKLNEVNWESFSAMAGITIRF